MWTIGRDLGGNPEKRVTNKLDTLVVSYVSPREDELRNKQKLQFHQHRRKGPLIRIGTLEPMKKKDATKELNFSGS